MYVLLGILAIAIIGYLIFVSLQKSNDKQLEQLINKQVALYELPIDTQFQTLNELHLSGESLNNLNNWHQHYRKIKDNDLPNYAKYLKKLQADNQASRVFKVKKESAQIEAALQQADRDLIDVQDGLDNLLANQADARQQVGRLKEKYQLLRKELLTKSFTFGPALDALESQLGDLEVDFDKANQMTISGDHLGAQSILEKVTYDTDDLEQKMTDIPAIYQESSAEFKAQIEEITTVHDQLVSQQHLNFDPEDFQTQLTEIETQIKQANTHLKALDLVAAQTQNQKTAQAIDQLYDRMEVEMNAKAFVQKNFTPITAELTTAFKQNKALSVELDHLNQSYVLTNHEIKNCQAITENLNDIEASLEVYKRQMSENQAVYSNIQQDLNNFKTQLQAAIQQQTEIKSDVEGLHIGEEVAGQNLDQFELEIKRLRRYVEKNNLPGLPEDYLAFYFVVEDEIKQLDGELNKLKIDLEAISQQMVLVQSDLDKLKKQTYEIVDAAKLTEQTIQYANRYRVDSPEIEAACQKAQYLFDNEFDYQQALDTIAVVLDGLEKGAYTEIEKQYYKQVDR